jgi:hypothetical protein
VGLEDTEISTVVRAIDDEMGYAIIGIAVAKLAHGLT